MKNPAHKLQRGFTLIELLVVVAIIGILATVVLASLGSATDKSKDAAIMATLSQMRAQAELQYDGTYNEVCEPSSQLGIMFADAFSKTNNTSPGSFSVCVAQDGSYYGGNPGGTISRGTNASFAGIDTNGSAWIAEIRLNGGDWFCVDALGNAKENSAQSRGTSPLDKTC